MPAWNDIRLDIEKRHKEGDPAAQDVIRREKLKAVFHITRIPLLLYAADFLNEHKVRLAAPFGGVSIDNRDKEGFLEVIANLPAGPLDVILHSSGGNPLAAESIVELLRNKFSPIRFIVPFFAKSAATMLALSGNEIPMDEAGELGPIDPQLVINRDQQIVVSPAQAILDQFQKAHREITAERAKLNAWFPILRQYGPSLIAEAENAIGLSKELTTKWMRQYMFEDDPEGGKKAEEIANWLGDHNNFRAHGRRVGIETLKDLGVKILDLRGNPELQNAIRQAYYATSVTFDRTGAFKIIENNLGDAYIRVIEVKVEAPRPQSPSSPAPNASQLSRAEKRRQKFGRK